MTHVRLTALLLTLALVPLAPLASASTGGPDAYGYRFVDAPTSGAPAYDFVELAGSGTETNLHCDDCMTTPLPIGFDFNFYGNFYSSVYASTNGFLSFDSTYAQYNPPAFPDTGPTNVIAAFWEDLDTRPAAPDDIMYATLGTAPHRVFVVEWNLVHHYSYNTPVVTFEVKLFEGRNDIEIHYKDAQTDGGNHLVGIMNADRSSYLTYAYGTFHYQDRAVLFTLSNPPSVPTPELGSLVLVVSGLIAAVALVAFRRRA